MKDSKNKTVFVGVSGGVDSSVSAALLKEATPKNFQRLFGRPTPKGFRGYNVVGVFIRTWTPDFIDCIWRDERRDAMRVCAHLDIPFLECDAEEAYKKGVADYMIEEYKKGNTPNPDVMCNREVKFGVFWKFAKERGADFIATGHYSQNNYELRIKNYELSKSVDTSKDQVYFLWTLTQDDLAHTLFPIGHLKKAEVRKLAEKYKLGTAIKNDSQGVCFLGPLDMKDFLKHYIDSKKGNVLLARRDNELGDIEGNIIGTHDGAMFFTLGERHGFRITKNSKDNLPHYVVSKDIEKNIIVVSTSPEVSFLSGPRISSLVNSSSKIEARPDHDKKEISGFVTNITNINWITGIPDITKDYTAQIRYHGEFLYCKIDEVEGTNAKIIFEKNILVDKGQSIVLYEDDICLGGGIVL